MEITSRLNVIAASSPYIRTDTTRRSLSRRRHGAMVSGSRASKYQYDRVRLATVGRRQMVYRRFVSLALSVIY